MARRRGTYKRRRTYPRRSYKRSSGYGKRRTFKRYGRVASKQLKLGFSRSQLVRLRYCQQVSLNPNTDSGSYIVYTANGAYQPNIALATGAAASLNHQPMGWDQWTAVYNDYVVIGSKIRVSAVSPNSANPAAGSGIIAILLSDSPTPFIVTATQGATTMIEQGRASYKQIGTNTSQGPCRVTHKFSSKKFWNLANIKDNVTRVGSDVNNNPAEQAYFHIYFYANDESVTSTTGPSCWITIDYVVLFSGPKDLTAS